MQRLRVLSIGHSYVVGMNRAGIRELARDPRLEITVAAPRFFYGDLRPITLEPEPAASPLRIVALATRWTRLVHLFRYDDTALKQLLDEGAFDVVHAWEEPYIYAGYQIARIAAKTGARFCFRTAQNNVKTYPPPFGSFERAVRARSQGWIAGGQLVFEAMRKRGYDPNRGQVIPLAVDTAAFKPLDSATRRRVRRELGLAGPTVGFVGRLTAAKGLAILMQALERVGASTPWSLLLLGSGPYRRQIEAWAMKHGWADRVRIRLVQHHEVPRYLPAMDLLAAPSQTTWRWREQFGRMLIEAFASGVPVIGSDSGEIPHVVGDAGRIVAEADVAAWGQALEELLTDAPARALLAARGLERAQTYSPVAVALSYRRYFHWLAQQPRSRPDQVPSSPAGRFGSQAHAVAASAAVDV